MSLGRKWEYESKSYGKKLRKLRRRDPQQRYPQEEPINVCDHLGIVIARLIQSTQVFGTRPAIPEDEAQRHRGDGWLAG